MKSRGFRIALHVRKTSAAFDDLWFLQWVFISGEVCPRVSDVTARYASDWCTATRKLRLNEWWQETLQPYAASKEDREMEKEDIMSE